MDKLQFGKYSRTLDTLQVNRETQFRSANNLVSLSTGTGPMYLGKLLESRDGSAGVLFQVEPGDHAQVADSFYGASAPIYFDSWYLYVAFGWMPTSKAEGEQWWDGIEHNFPNLGGCKPLRLGDLTGKTTWGDIRSAQERGPYWPDSIYYAVAGWLDRDQSETYDWWTGYQTESGGMNAWLAIPVGIPGAMYGVSLMRQYGYGTVDPVDGGAAFPPVNLNEMPQIQVMNPYGMTTEWVEGAPCWRGTRMAEWYHWAVTIKLTEYLNWPVPGEFLAAVAQPLMTHVWWFQETSPVVTSGIFFETMNYTSGKVSGIKETAGQSGCKIYTVDVHGWPVDFAPTDYYEYQVGELVAVVMRYTAEPAEVMHTDWSHVSKWQSAQIDTNTVAANAFIAPISFYEN